MVDASRLNFWGIQFSSQAQALDCVPLRRLHPGYRLRLLWEIPKVQTTWVYNFSGKIKQLCTLHATIAITFALTAVTANAHNSDFLTQKSCDSCDAIPATNRANNVTEATATEASAVIASEKKCVLRFLRQSRKFFTLSQESRAK